MSRPRLDAHTIRTVAVRAHCDPRSVAAVYGGGRVRGMSDARIRVALVELGLAPMAPLGLSDVASPVALASLVRRAGGQR